MEFTCGAYAALLKKINDKGYVFKNYTNWREAKKTVILRHDVDYSLKRAVTFSEIEKNMKEVSATYFVLLSTDFYNLHSRESRECIRCIMQNGGRVGLHFDETQYSIADESELKEYVSEEVKILSDIIGTKIDAVSMHRPSSRFLDLNMQFPDIINSYDQVFFREMKYLSDSRRNWKEDINVIIESSMYHRLHILTHPFWYMEKKEKNLGQTLKEAILNASLAYYDNMNNNFRSLQTEVEREEIERIVYQ